jgi:hypothetical protein
MTLYMGLDYKFSYKLCMKYVLVSIYKLGSGEDRWDYIQQFNMQYMLGSSESKYIYNTQRGWDRQDLWQTWRT